jgi:hypothetical protein
VGPRSPQPGPLGLLARLHLPLTGPAPDLGRPRTFGPRSVNAGVTRHVSRTGVVLRLRDLPQHTSVGEVVDGRSRAHREARSLLHETFAIPADIRLVDGRMHITLNPLAAPTAPAPSPGSARTSPTPKRSTPPPTTPSSTPSETPTALHERTALRHEVWTHGRGRGHDLHPRAAAQAAPPPPDRPAARRDLRWGGRCQLRRIGGHRHQPQLHREDDGGGPDGVVTRVAVRPSWALPRERRGRSPTNSWMPPRSPGSHCRVAGSVRWASREGGGAQPAAPIAVAAEHPSARTARPGRGVVAGELPTRPAAPGYDDGGPC